MRAGVWSGKGTDEEAADQLRALLAKKEQLPEEQRTYLDNLPPELLAELEAVPQTEPVPPAESYIQALPQAGLIHREGEETPLDLPRAVV